MEMTDKSLCNSCTNIGCEFQSGIVRTKCAFYMPPQLEPDNCGNYVVQDSTTKNDIRDNRVKNELNRVKDELEPTTKNYCAEQNGCISCSLDDGDDCCRKLYEESMQELLRINLRVDCISRQAVVDMTGLSEWFDSSDSYNEFVIALSELPSVTPQEPIECKVEDCISREQAKSAIRDKFKDLPSRVEINTILNELPPVTPQEPQSFKWCTDCKEYEQEKHCCHRYSKVIRDTVAEIRQEPILDKIREEIGKSWHTKPKNRYEEGLKDQALKDMQIIDKYMSEGEVQDGND